jgi:hypothetical protein
MKFEDYQNVGLNLGKVMMFLETLEETVIKSFGDKSHSAIWVRLAACYIALVGVYFTQEYQDRYPDESEEGGWSMSE